VAPSLRGSLREGARRAAGSGPLEATGTTAERVTRDRTYAARAVTAAARMIDLASESGEKDVKRRNEQWQDDAWRFADELPEVDSAQSWVSNAVSRVRLVPAVVDDVGDEPVPISLDGDDDLDLKPGDRELAHATLRRLKGPDGGHSELLRVAAACAFLPGEFYLYGSDDDEGQEVWEALSRDELVAPGPDGAKYGRRRRGPAGIATSGNEDAEPVPTDAFVARIFRRHARYSDWATSNMRAARTICDELLLHTLAIRASATSRIPQGMLLIPKDASFGTADPTDDEGDLEGEGDKFDSELLEHLTTPIKKPDSAARLVPFIVRLDSEDIEKVRLLQFGRDFADESRQARAELIPRLAWTLDLPADALMGKGELNHWNAFQVDEDGFKYHLEPLVLLVVMGLTAAYYRPTLAAAGLDDPGRFCIWYDPSELVSHPNGADQAFKLHDRIVISDAYLRSVTGTPEGATPDDDEVKRRVAVKIAERARPTLQESENQVVDETVGEADGVAKPDAGDEPPATDSTPGAPAEPSGEAAVVAAARGVVARAEAAARMPTIAAVAASARSRRVEHLGRRLGRIEAETRARVVSDADAAMRRTLDRAGSRLRSLTNGHPDYKALIRGRPNLEVAGALGPAVVEQLAGSNEELIAGGIAGLEETFRSRVQAARDQARAATARAAGTDDPGPDPGLVSDQGAALDAGWGLLSAGLVALGAALLYEPHQPAPAEGEFDSTSLVPVRLVREALLEAGGGPGGTAMQLRLDFWSGLLSGDLADRMLAQFGLEIGTAGTWSCGAPDRPFEPHQDLEGVPFAGPEDDVLAAPPDEFPFVSFYAPQDHDGCQCQADYDVNEATGPEGPADPTQEEA